VGFPFGGGDTALGLLFKIFSTLICGHPTVKDSYCNAVGFRSVTDCHVSGYIVNFSRFGGSTAWIRLSAWLKDMENWSDGKDKAASVAFREMGTNAIPALLNIFRSGSSPIEKMISRINRKQSLVDFPIGPSAPQSLAASRALYAMGANARSALPALTNLLFHTNALMGTIALAGIGSEAVPTLLMALTNQDSRIRLAAASGLGWIRSDFDIVVPALIARFHDSNSMVHHSAVSSLGQLHSEPELAVPALMSDLSSPDVLLRSAALISLSRFKDKAKPSVPMIENALKDNDQTVQKIAAVALKRIDPEAASKAGVK
jgi:HEAT repeat protein